MIRDKYRWLIIKFCIIIIQCNLVTVISHQYEYLQYLAMDIIIILSCDLMQVRNDYHLRHDDDDEDDYNDD